MKKKLYIKGFTFLDEQIWQGMKYPNGFYRASGTVTIIK